MVSIIDGQCKLTDFGFGAQLLDSVDNGKRMSVVGTSFWMAPEGIVPNHSHDSSKETQYLFHANMQEHFLS